MKPIGKYGLIILVFFGTFFLLTGCGYKDIDKRFFVVGVGIDPAKNQAKKYAISLKFAISSVEKKPNDFIIVTEEANTIAEAVRMIKTKVDKEVDFSHAKVIVINESLAKKKLEPHIYYWFSRRRDFQKISWVLIGRPSAISVLKDKPKFEQIPSNTLFLTLGNEGSETPYIIPEFLFDFKKRFTEKGLDPYLPIVEPKKGLLVIRRAALFDKKHIKIVLEPEETKFLNYLLNKEQKSAIKISNHHKVFLIDTQKVRTSYKMDTSDLSHPTITIKVNIKGRLEETLFSPKNSKLQYYEKLANDEMNKFGKHVLVKIQRANVDPVGFGLYYRARHFQKNDWQAWQKIYPNIIFKVKSNIQIEDTGLIE